MQAICSALHIGMKHMVFRILGNCCIYTLQVVVSCNRAVAY